MSSLAKRRISLLVVAAFLATIPFLAAKTFWPATPGPSASQILEIHNGSLTSYLGGATDVQDIRPRVEQRGVNVDGSLRAGSTLPMHLNGNPYGAVWGANQTLNGIRTFTGVFSPTEVDLALPAEGPNWVIGRSYNNRQDDGGSHHDSNGYQGKNWFQMSQPEIELYDHPTDAAEDVVYLIYGADRFIEFQRYDSSSTEFKAVNGAAGVIQFTDGGEDQDPDLFVYTDQWSNEFYFFGFDGDAGSATGQFWKVKDAEGLEAYAGDADLANDPIQLGYDSGRITTAYDSEDRRYTYTYTTLNSVDRLTKVVAETKSGGTWTSPTGVEEVAKVEYEYYGDETYGDIGDLKLVEITTPLTDSTVSQVKKKYFRYWEGTFNATTNPGHPHSLKLVLDFEGARNYDWTGDSTFDEDFKAASHATLETYALAVFEYDSSRRVDDAYFGGACGCGGGADGTHTLTYETNGSYTDNSGYDTTWSNRTVIGRPDGSYVTQYFDEAAQSLHQVITDDVPTANPAPDKWVTKITRSSDAIVTDLSTPANVTGYTHSSGAITTSTSAGLVRTWTLETTGDTKNFVLDQKYKTGTSGSAYYEGSQDYATGTLVVGDVTAVRPIIDDKKEYVNATTSPVAADYNQTTWSPAWYTSKLVPKSNTATLPKVTTAKNGSDTAPSLRQAFDEQGRKTWEEDEEGVIASWLYESGRVKKYIRDADTTKTGVGEDFEGITPPFSSDAGAVHRKDTNSFDAQGRQEETTIAEGRVTKTYVSKLKDERLITLSYPKYDSGTPKFYGPVRVTVTNQAGQVEMQGVVELTSNESTSALTAHIDETESDPLLAIDVGTVGQMTTSLYDDAGTQRTEKRLYHSVPSSGAGSDGTNYDPTLLGYDDSGRQWRTKAAHGTINRTVYDAIGRVSARWIGTNDSTFSGGESSGTDDMVKTDDTVYDAGADDGNSYVTKRTSYVEDSTTDKRETSYSHDVRGNVLLTTNPTAPHIFVKLDNLGRNIASGSFSSTASIVVGTDDPTTETTNRLALTQTLYDQRGRVWKTKRHKIDASDGSDDDNLVSESWFDETGRTIKVDGEQLTKTTYDRLGRVTHQFTLATDNDTVFADADDVTGDIVLVERQTTYESTDSDEVWMEATISRFHDDRDSGETTGALDTNADSDDLKYTAANLEGRIQITASWYDNTGRLEDVVRYGTYNDADFDRDALTVPARSDTALRTTYVYNTDGTQKSVTDPQDLETRIEYDDTGRQTAVIRNYVNGTPSSSTGDDDVHTRYVYTDGLRTKLWVDIDGDNTVDTGDQDTIYTYGTTKGASAGDSEIGTGHLLQKVQYPDSSGGTDVVTYAYNAQSQRIYTKDQVGYILERNFDDSGRLEHRRATNVATASGLDEEILRIATSYDSLGRREKVTQYDNATVGSGTVQDEVKYTYDGWGNLEKIEQDNNSAVVASGDEYSISYAFEKNTTGRNTIRRTTMTAPSGNVFEYKYRDIAGRHDDDCSRVTHINDGATLLALYDYNGQSQVVGTDYTGIDVMRQRWGSTSGDYPAFDRFDRVVEDTWLKDLATDVAIYDIDLTYDRNSNITSLDEHVHAGFDVDYTIDNLDRLTRAQEGTLSGATITSESRDQTWNLDQVGNWEDVTLDFDADNVYTGTDEYDDDRVHNDVNEITERDTDDDETADHTLVYDAAGNLTDDGESYKYEYDVFYRLRKVKNQSDALVAEYRYNGLGHRIAEHTDTDDDGDVDANDDWHHFAYDERWRVVAMFVDTDTTPTEEFMHHSAGDSGYGGASYIDEVAIRDRDTDANGSLEERIFYCQNWRHDVVCLVDGSGDQREMVRYSAYGVPFGSPGGDTDSDGDNDATDITQIQTWIDAPTYDVRGDIDLDGDVDASDKSKANSAPLSGLSLGRGALTGFDNTRGYAGYVQDAAVAHRAWHVRRRSLDSSLGRWASRDPAGYVDGASLYAAFESNPLARLDPSGLDTFSDGQCIQRACVVQFLCPDSGEVSINSRLSDDDGPGVALDDCLAKASGDAECNPGDQMRAIGYHRLCCEGDEVVGSCGGHSDLLDGNCAEVYCEIFVQDADTGRPLAHSRGDSVWSVHNVAGKPGLGADQGGIYKMCCQVIGSSSKTGGATVRTDEEATAPVD